VDFQDSDLVSEAKVPSCDKPRLRENRRYGFFAPGLFCPGQSNGRENIHMNEKSEKPPATKRAGKVIRMTV